MAHLYITDINDVRRSRVNKSWKFLRVIPLLNEQTYIQKKTILDVTLGLRYFSILLSYYIFILSVPSKGISVSLLRLDYTNNHWHHSTFTGV